MKTPLVILLMWILAVIRDFCKAVAHTAAFVTVVFGGCALIMWGGYEMAILVDGLEPGLIKVVCQLGGTILIVSTVFVGMSKLMDNM